MILLVHNLNAYIFVISLIKRKKICVEDCSTDNTYEHLKKYENVDVNTKIPAHLRRVRFENMIYIADGPSDVPAFSTLNKSGGYTFAIYPHNDSKAFEQVEQLRKDGRINMYG